tara:strand:- start:64 stop:465 length:402 start_codon:yes stop_codon:yes gene_type:complete
MLRAVNSRRQTVAATHHDRAAARKARQGGSRPRDVHGSFRLAAGDNPVDGAADRAFLVAFFLLRECQMISTRQIQKWIDSPHQSLHNAALVEAVPAFVQLDLWILSLVSSEQQQQCAAASAVLRLSAHRQVVG